MDACEATNIVMSRVHNLDPENASKIMGYILIEDDSGKEMIRLALGTEALLLSCVNKVRAHLGLSSNTSSAKPLETLSNSGMRSNSFSPRVTIPNSPSPISYAAVLSGSTSGENETSNNGPSSLQFDDSTVDSSMSTSGRSDSLISPYGEDAHGVPSLHPRPFHRRSSANDAVFLSTFEEGGGGGRGFGRGPCVYFTRGFCKNGNSCKFFHGDNGGGGEMIGATSLGSDEFLKMKAIQQHKVAAVASKGHHFFPRSGPRNDFSQITNSRKIYVTFPAYSTFDEEDVSRYFSVFGPVQNVRIPFQPKRMFGFVTFVDSETVKLILAREIRHYVCNFPVFVKPYKDKEELPEKKRQSHRQHEHSEMGEYSARLSPSGVDYREIYDVPNRPMFFNTQEMMLRGKLEHEAELQHAIELQCRRMTNLQLANLENPQNSQHRFLPRQQQLLMSENFVNSPLSANNRDVLRGDDEKLLVRDQLVNDDDSYESMEYILPDNPFASPTKLAAEPGRMCYSEKERKLSIGAYISRKSLAVYRENDTEEKRISNAYDEPNSRSRVSRPQRTTG